MTNFFGNDNFFIQNRKRLDRYILVLFVQELITFAVSFGVYFLTSSAFLEKNHSVPLNLLSNFLESTGALDLLLRLLWLVPAIFYGAYHFKADLPSRKLNVPLPVIFAAICFLSFLARIPGSALFGYDANIEHGFSYSGFELFLWIISITLVAPLTEEYVFRELSLRALSPFGRNAYILVSSLLFALQHAPGSALSAFVIGLVFAYIRYTSGKISYSIGMHIAFNSLSAAITLLYKYASDNIYTAFSLIYLSFVIVLGLCAFIWCALELRKMHKQKRTLRWLPTRCAFSPIVILFLFLSAIQYALYAINML